MGAGVAEILPRPQWGRLDGDTYYRGVAFTGVTIDVGGQSIIASAWCEHRHRTIDAALKCGRRLSRRDKRATR